jgi:hypothetical protein
MDAESGQKTTALFCFPVRLVFAAKRTELLKFETLCGRLLILHVAVVSALTLRALELYDFACHE